MEEIKLGEYVRTKNGVIFKITGGNADDYDIDISYYDLGYFEDGGYSDLDMFNYNDNGNFIREIVIKHSFNIIDLIEVGDYINGKEIILKDENENCVMYGFKYKDTQMIWHIYEEDVHSIVTKEQFASVEYKVKENNNG